MSRGRGPGPGRIEKTGSGYNGIWTDAAGKRHRQLLGRSRDDAQRALSKIIRDRDLERTGLGAETQQQRPLAEIVERYLREIATYRRPSYVRTTTMSLERLSKFLGPTRICDLKVERILDFRRRRIEDGAGNRTANIDVNSLRAALRWAAQCGLIHLSPIANVRPLPTDEATQRRRRRALTEAEIVRFVAAAEEVDRRRAAHFAAEKTIASGVLGKAYAARIRKPAIPQAILWRTLLVTGARWGEIVTLRWADIDEDARLMRVRSEVAKSKRMRVVPLTPSLIADIMALRRIHVRVTGRIPSPTDCVFLGVKGGPWKFNANGPAGRMLKVVLAKAGIPEIDAAGRKIDIHSLRRTCCTRLLRFGVPLNTAARLLGHRDTRTTSAHYVDVEGEDLVAAVGMVPEIGAKTTEKPESDVRATTASAM